MSNGVGARQVGEFIQPRRMIRSVMNPMDKATVVSIFPKEINDVKETIYPGRFIIPKGSFDDPTIVVVGPSSWWRDFDIEQPIQEVPVSAVQIADSIIRDYCNGLLGVDMGSAMPGFFFAPGEIEKEEILSKYKLKLVEAKAKQDNWYHILIRLADSLWARGNGNPLMIWDEMRLAARELGIDTKPWLKDYQTVEMVRCFACGSLRNPEYPICPTCKVVDTKHPMAKDIKFST